MEKLPCGHERFSNDHVAYYGPGDRLSYEDYATRGRRYGTVKETISGDDKREPGMILLILDGTNNKGIVELSETDGTIWCEEEEVEEEEEEEEYEEEVDDSYE